MRALRWFRLSTWGLLAVAAAAGVLVALGLSVAMPDRYRAEATLALTGESATRELQLTYAQMLTSAAYLAEVAPGLGISADELSDGLRAVPAPGTVLIGIFVTNGNEQEAIERANAVADGFGAFLVDSDVSESGSVVVTQRATEAAPTGSTWANALLGGSVAFVCAAAILVFARPRRGAGVEESRQERPEEREVIDLV